MHSRPLTLSLLCCLCVALLVAGCTTPPPEFSPAPAEDPARIDIEAGDLGPFCETAAVFDDRVVFSFIPTGTDVSDYLVTYEVQVDGTTRARVDQQRFEGVGAADPIVITEPRGAGACVGISITIATPDGDEVYVSSSSAGGE